LRAPAHSVNVRAHAYKIAQAARRQSPPRWPSSPDRSPRATRPPGFGSDFQASYFGDWPRWAGIGDIAEISFRPDLATADADCSRQATHAAARDLAKTFLLAAV